MINIIVIVLLSILILGCACGLYFWFNKTKNYKKLLKDKKIKPDNKDLKRWNRYGLILQIVLVFLLFIFMIALGLQIGDLIKGV